jgi:tetratricopeptide (TPR) repeat protein
MKITAKIALAAALTSCLALLAGCPDEGKKKSIEQNNNATKALGAKQFETAINAYEESVEAWKDNHMAWYGLGQAQAARGNWKEASDAFTESVKIKDDDAMYHMWLGRSLYESAVAQAREDQAKREGKKPEEINPDLKGVNFDPALQHLQAAVKINGELWRAHYYLGRIYREQDKAKEAAEAFTRAIQNNPREQGPYVALGEMYRRWDYTDQAIQVTTQGAANVPGQNERSEVYFVLGMAHNDKKNLEKAIEAFTHALEDRKDIHKAKFQRGKAYFEKGEMTKAKKDLEEYAKSAGTDEGFNKGLANKFLLDIAAKQI